MKKRGATHVGVILSFVVFVSFLVFLYTALEPAVKQDKDKQVVLDFLEEVLVEEVSGEMTEASIKIKDSYQGPQTPFDDCVRITVPDFADGNPAFVKDKDDNIIGLVSAGQAFEISWNSANDFFKFYYHDSFIGSAPEDVGDCEPLVKDTDYEIAYVRTNTYILKSKINELEIRYADYEILKNNLNIPAGTEFGFSFEDSNGNTISVGETGITASIYVDEIPIQYVNETANINTGFITIRVW